MTPLPQVPVEELAAPSVLRWYRVYGVVVGVGLVLFAVAYAVGMYGAMQQGSIPAKDRAQLMAVVPLAAGVYGFAGLIMAVAPWFAPRCLAAYLFHAILIVASMAGCCTMPFAAALLVAWLKPEVRMYFGVGE